MLSKSLSLKFSFLLAVVSFLSQAGVSRAGGLTWDAVQDFNGTNPNGTWSYLGGNSVGSPLTPLSSPAVFTPQISGVWNAGSTPDAEFVLRNYGPGNAPYDGTIVLPTNLLSVDPQSGAVDVQWTAPAAGDYTVNGSFQGIDPSSDSHEVQIFQNLAGASQTSLLSDPLAGYGAQVAFSFDRQLNAGETIDFVVNSTGDFRNLGTGFDATIAPAGPVSTPLPSSAYAGLTLLSGLGLFSLRRRKATML